MQKFASVGDPYYMNHSYKCVHMVIDLVLLIIFHNVAQLLLAYLFEIQA